ncbi:MAG: phosphotransferase [Motilibacteraceae bacterium]
MQVPDERVVAWVRADFGLELTGIEPVEHGADGAALRWRGVDVDGRAYAVKLSGGGSAAATAVPSWLAARDVGGVVGPVRTLDGGLGSERAGRRLSVVPWVEGERALVSDLPLEDWSGLGRLLAAVHTCEPGPDVAATLPCERFEPEPLTARVRALDRRLADPEVPDELALAVVAVWADRRKRIAELAAGAERLGAALRDEPAPLVLCHGDPHLGNVLAGEHGPWLLDWDDALLAPPEQDLMFFLDGGILLPFAPVTPAQEEAFLRGYGPVDVDPRRLAYLRAARALVDLVDPAEQALDVDRPEDEREDALQIVRWVLADDGLLALALEAADAGLGSAGTITAS